MIIDLTHNKIVKESMSESFAKSFSERLVPSLSEKFGESLLGIQMYEDYISKNPVLDGFFYYPLSLMTKSGIERVYIRWDISDKKRFPGKSPYSFVGDSLDFEIVNTPPEAIVEKLRSEPKFFDGEYIKISVNAAVQDITLLSGKYSQSFIDEMARQLTPKISELSEVEGLALSSVELSMVFAPETYMEHTSENVTYRRLLMSAKGCSPRDFWVKWKRLDAESAFSVRHEVSCDNILFEIGEDVPHKIREKEYRFLVFGNSDKYRAAMGRKNITEWREIIKRALKRGELAKCCKEELASQESETPHDDVSDQLSKILEKCGISAEPIKVEVEQKVSTEFDEAMRIARAAMGYTDNTEPDKDGKFTLGEPLEITVSKDESIVEISEEAATEENEEEQVFVGSFEEDMPSEPDISEEISEESFEEDIENTEAFIEEDIEEDELFEEERDFEVETEEIEAPFEEEFFEKKFEAEAPDGFLEELGKLKEENRRLSEKLNEAQTLLKKQAEEQEKILRQMSEMLKEQERERAREKALFAEAARLAAEENEAEARRRAEKEAEIAAEERRLEEIRREEERMLVEKLRREEVERIERERRAFEEAERESAYRPAESFIPQEPKYISKVARLMFRHNVDPNVTGRIHEMISMALSHFHKENVYIKIKASIPEPSVVILDFVKIPENEMELLVDIIKFLGNSDLGITKVILE